jgi:hypothetical protein
MFIRNRWFDQEKILSSIVYKPEINIGCTQFEFDNYTLGQVVGNKRL